MPPGACDLTIGQTVIAEANTRLWSNPDVTAGDQLGPVPTGQQMQISDGPTLGPVVLATGEEGFWWKVDAEGSRGWIWQECLE